MIRGFTERILLPPIREVTMDKLKLMAA